MAFSNLGCEDICKEIHDSWRKPNQLIKALASLNQFECWKIRETYLKLYGEDPVHLLQSNKSSSQRNESEVSVSPQVCSMALSMLMLNPHERDVIVAREALEQNDINYKALIEIFTCRKSSHVLLIIAAYQARFRRQLDQDIISIEPSHPYQRILMALSASHKTHQADISQNIAKCGARRLYQTGEGKSGAIDEAVVLETLSKRVFLSSSWHFPAISTFMATVIQMLDHDLGRITNIQGTQQLKYFAETLYACLKGATKDKGALIRIMVSRAEVDMDEIARIFKKYGMELKYAISESIPPGDYSELLVALATKISTSNAASLRNIGICSKISYKNQVALYFM